MEIRSLEITDVRNLRRQSFDLDSGLNLFVGENGAGKTAILEAVHVLGKGRSFRTHRVSRLIREGCTELIVRGELEKDGQHRSIAISKSKRVGTRLRLNGEPESLLSRVASELPLQVMLPDVSDLVFGSPAERRQFLDWGLFHVKHGYHAWLRDFHRLLKQRNAWLRTQQDQANPDSDPWGGALCDKALEIHGARAEYIQSLSERLVKAAGAMGLQFRPTLEYQRGWKDEENLRNLMADTLPRDVKLGSTQLGPHRADMLVRADEAPATHHVSRGQGKVISSALNIAQAQHLQSELGQKSVFLIDDLGAELDRDRSARLFRILTELGCQVLATAVDVPPALEAGGGYTLFHVKHGVVTKVQKE